MSSTSTADVPATASSTATMDISVDAPQDAALALDINGDGVPDATLSATSSETQDPLQYLLLMRSSVDGLGIGKPVSKQLTAQLKNLQAMLHGLNKAGKKALGQQIERKLGDIESHLEAQLAAARLSPAQTTALLTMLEHLKELLQ